MRRTTGKPSALLLVALLATLGTFPARATAQLASASAATLAKGGNATATVRGFAALGVNPAGLGMPGSGFSLALAPVRLLQGLDPITLSDFADFDGKLLPTAAKEDWLTRVRRNGSQTGSVGVEISELALTVGRIGLQLSTIASGNISLNPDIVELALYGNAGRTGSPEDFSLVNSSLNGYAISTGGLSIGLPLPSASADVAIGATFKYSIGHAVAVARERSGSITSDPIRVQVDFPLIHTDQDEVGNSGSGVGLDLGFQYHAAKLSLGAAVLNAFNTFTWDEAKLDYRPIKADVRKGAAQTETDPQAYSGAPADLRSAISDMTFDPVLELGAAYDVSGSLTVSGDLHTRFGDGLDIGPKFHLGAGAEWRGIPVLPLRVGAAVITDGVQLGGGASLVLGPVNLSFAGAVRTGSLEDTTIAMFGLSFGSN